MRYLRPLAKIIKGLYDILAGYLLAWVLLFALVAYGLQQLLALAVAHADFDSVDQCWRWSSHRASVSSLTLRLAGACFVHLTWLVLLRKPLMRLWGLVDRGIAAVERAMEGFGKRFRRTAMAWSLAFTVGVTALLVPFVIQPTLVPRSMSGTAWAARAANLADGTASAAFVESVVGLYSRITSTPVASRGGGKEAWEVAFPEDSGQTIPIHDGGDPGLVVAPPPPTSSFMDRWDPTIRQVVGKDRKRFALVKALIWVESGGRQFAVSTTGCVGLTQFCGPTARTNPYRKVFGVGKVYPCNCDGACRVDRAVQKDLESGDMEKLLGHKESFPCDLSDARFDPARAIKAGNLYVGRMLRAYGGNIFLLYIGYNSGPAVASRVWRAAGRDPKMGLAEIEQHLAASLKPYFGASSDHRARSLLRVHLPKLKAAYRRYKARSSERM